MGCLQCSCLSGTSSQAQRVAKRVCVCVCVCVWIVDISGIHLERFDCVLNVFCFETDWVMFAEKTTIGQCNRFLFTLSCFVLSALHYVDCQCWVLCLLMSLLSVECLNSSLLVQYFAQFEYFIYYFTVCGKIIISSHGFTMSVLAASYSHYWLLCTLSSVPMYVCMNVCMNDWLGRKPVCVICQTCQSASVPLAMSNS